MIKQRIIQLIEYKQLKKELFYKKIGVTSGNFRGENRKTPVNSNIIESILTEIPDVNLNWLISGKGEMLIEKKKIYPTLAVAEADAVPYELREKSEMSLVLEKLTELTKKIDELGIHQKGKRTSA